MKNVRVLAPAKINLFLEILNKRSDGYHNVDMVMQAVNFYDELTIQYSDQTIKKRIGIICDKNLNCKKQEENIVYKCADAFMKYINCEHYELKFELRKNIPVGAGLAGGSSDGAAALVGLNALFGNLLSKKDLCDVGEKIGADIPFCITGGTAVASDKGTVIENVHNDLKYFLVIVKPTEFVSTAQAYCKVDNILNKVEKTSSTIISSIKCNNLAELGKNLFNRFEEVIDIKKIFEIKKLMFENECLGSCMSGSGSSVFGLFESEDKAVNFAKYVKKIYKEVFICKPINHGAIII